MSIRFDASAAPKDSRTGAREAMPDQEEELILTAWQNMARGQVAGADEVCTVLQKHDFTEEPRSPGPAQSFLAKQRLSTLRPKSKT